jgi:predicted hydrocarbon binding protein
MAITIENGGFQSYHNYYHPKDFFRHELEQGSIYVRDGQRVVKVTEDFINGLQLGVEEEVGQNNGSLLMYKCGYEWGLQDMKRFNDRMRQEFGGGKLDIWQMNKRFVFESWWWPLTASGFGGWSLDLSFSNQGLTVVEIRNSAIAHAMKIVGKPVCHVYAGLFAGVFSVYEQEDKQCIEVQCYSMGNDVCKFMIGNEKQVNAAEFWRQEGATASEILANFNVD